MHPFDAFAFDLRQALRALRRRPGYVATVVGSLALGIGGSVAAFGVLDAIRLRALPFPAAERLVVVSEVPAGQGKGAPDCALRCDVSYTTFSQVLRPRTFSTIEALAGFTSGGKVYMAGGAPVPVSGGVISPNVFALMGAVPQLGRALTAADDQLGVPLVTVLSHDMWATFLGADPAIIGKVVKLSDSQYTVVGVMPPGFDFESGSKFWLPAVPTLDPSTRPSIRSLTVLARLAPGRTIAEARAELAAVELPLATSGGTRVAMQLEARPLRERYVSATQSHDAIFAAMVGCLMLLACANLANLALVRALDQQREFAMRSALGARRGRLVRHLLIEHAVLVVVSTVLGLVVAGWLLEVLQQAAALASLRPTRMSFALDARAVAFAVVAALVVGAVLAVAPLRVALSTEPRAVLRDGALGGGGQATTQRIFVVAQVAAAFVLLTAGALLSRAALRLADVDVGFDAAHVITASPSFPHPWRVPERYLPVTEAIVRDLAAIPGTRAVAMRARVPLRGAGSAPAVVVDGGSAPLADALVPASVTAVGPDYFAATGIAVRRGRAFDTHDVAGGAPVAIVSEWTARRWWPGTDPIGRTVRIDTAPQLSVQLTVVGVAADSRASSPGLLFAQQGPELYRPWLQAHTPYPAFVVMARGDAAALVTPVRDILVRAVPDRPLSVEPAAHTIDDQVGGARANASQALAVAAVGLLLAIVGVYGVLTYVVGRRTREIGIRAAIGASTWDIVRLVLGGLAWLVLLGLVIGALAARLTTPLLSSLLHDVPPTDPVSYAAVGGALLLASGVAAAIPLRRALRIAPADALRSAIDGKR
ncbi:MAG: ABC transporter permease [Gemmatimonadaceae bacterium]|nr:ABC transporter permease [Gemmatimonadaceae bacterium]